MKKILVTGTNGYLGSTFINQYEKKYSFEKFSLLSQKIEDINFEAIDIVLHCAALVHQKKEHSYEKYHEINVDYPVELAKLAKQNGVKQFIFMSTVAVFGEDEEILNDDTLCTPVTHYGVSKLQAEKQLLKLNDDNFVVSVIRAPMIYGKDAPGNIESLLKLVKKLPIIPLGGIKNRRSFISIQNLCHILYEVIEQKATGVFLAADDEPLSTTRLIELIAEALGKKVTLVKVPFFESALKLLKPSFHKRLYGSLEIDNSLTKERLNLQNPYSVDKGILLMIHEEV